MDPEKATFLFGDARVGPELDGLDPDDPDDRAELLAQNNAGLSGSALKAREILATQIVDEAPPEVWSTARRLLDQGTAPPAITNQLLMALGRAIMLAVETEDAAFDGDVYVTLLGSLPLPAADEVDTAIIDAVRAHPCIGDSDLDRVVLERLGRQPDDELVTLLIERCTEYLLDEDGPLALLTGDRTVHVGDLTAGIVATHRLTDAERESGALATSFDLAGFRRRDRLSLPDGTEVAWEIGDDADNLVWVAEDDGWLAQFTAGALLAVRVDEDGVVRLEQLAADPPFDDDLLRLLRSVYDEEVAEPWLPVSAEELVIGMLAEDKGVFNRPLPPLAELCELAGLERRGELVAHESSVWRTRTVIRRVARVFDGLDEKAERDAAGRVLDAVGDANASREQIVQALFYLAEPAVALAVVDALVPPDRDGDEEIADAVRFAEELVAAARTPRQIAVARWMSAVVAERTGEVLVADAHLTVGVEEGAVWGPLVERAAWYASDRGDARGALRLWRSLAEPDAEDIDTVAPFARPVGSKLGRNDACWCGSGRKYKVCHLGRPQAVPLADRVGWLCRKANAYLEHQGGRAARLLVGLAAACAGEPKDIEALASAMADPIVTDVALAEGGWFARFIEDRGRLLPDDEARLGHSWSHVERTVYEVLDVTPGDGLTVRDLRTGDSLAVRERTFSRQARPGLLVCARAVPDGESHQFVGTLFPVAPGTESDVLDLCDEGDPLAICLWVAGLHRPPALRTREGEPMVTCAATVEVGDPASARLVLDRCFDAEGGGWVEMHALDDDGLILRAQLTLDGRDIRITTHSESRMERVLGVLADELPDSRVVVDERIPLSSGQLPAPPTFSGDEADFGPADAGTMAEIQDHLERVWVDEAVPALGGLTPTQAAANLTRRGELERLIASFPDPDVLPPGAIAMRPDRLRVLLGLVSPLS